jgi:hypothetical protein
MRKARCYLRIAWSVFCGIVCLLLVALWVRSYSCWDRVVGNSVGNYGLVIMSVRGTVYSGYSATNAPLSWSLSSYTNPRQSNGMVIADDGPARRVAIELSFGPLGFGMGGQSIFVPHWFLFTVAGSLSAIPWFRWRFSLRTLLVAMTLAAVGLGLIVRAVR